MMIETEQGGKVQFCIRREENNMEKAPELTHRPETLRSKKWGRRIEEQELAKASSEGEGEVQGLLKKGVEGTRQ